MAGDRGVVVVGSISLQLTKRGSPDNVDKLDGGDVIHFVCHAIQTIHGSIRGQKGFEFRQIAVPTAYQIYGSLGTVVPIA